LALTFLFIGIIPEWFWTDLELHLVLLAIPAFSFEPIGNTKEINIRTASDLKDD